MGGTGNIDSHTPSTAWRLPVWCNDDKAMPSRSHQTANLESYQDHHFTVVYSPNLKYPTNMKFFIKEASFQRLGSGLDIWKGFYQQQQLGDIAGDYQCIMMMMYILSTVDQPNPTQPNPKNSNSPQSLFTVTSSVTGTGLNL
ncbi:hypothetical protein V8B97DRAFT_1916502 [Scleroderma yunnanense]